MSDRNGDLREVSGVAKRDATLAGAMDRVRAGTPFGDVFEAVAEGDRSYFRWWYCHTNGVPTPDAVKTRLAALPPRAAPDPPAAHPTGDVCANCGGTRMVWSGACRVCLDCGTSGGCG